MLRVRITCLAAIAAALVLAAPAAAHTIPANEVVVNCAGVTFQFSNFTDGDNDVIVTIVDTVQTESGIQTATSTIPVTIKGPSGSYPIVAPAPVNTTKRDVTIHWTADGGGTTFASAPGCGTVTPPVTPPVAQPPVIENPPAAPLVVPATPGPAAPTPAVPTPVVYKPHLTLTKQALDKHPLVGHSVRYTLKVCNTGKGDAKNVTLSDDGGNGLTFTARNGGTMSGGSLQWHLGTIKAASCHPLVGVQMRVDSDAHGSVSNNATVTASNGNTAHDQACVAPRQHKRKPKLPQLVTG